jgi:hypothetical protein
LKTFVRENKDDPAVKVSFSSIIASLIALSVQNFFPKLQDHFLGRFLSREFDGDTHGTFTHEERNTIVFKSNLIYRTETMKANYTTYDVRRDYDIISPKRNCFIMVRSAEDDPNAHPYWYAQVLGIFHTEVRHYSSSAEDHRYHYREFLWVRWLGSEPEYRSGPRYARLPKVGFVPDTDEYAFGFLDPSLVIRASHLIPAFASGSTTQLLDTTSPTFARRPGEMNDWTNFYANM